MSKWKAKAKNAFNSFFGKKPQAAVLSQFGRWVELPKDLLVVSIGSFFTPEDLANTGVVCKAWGVLNINQWIWKRQYEMQEFPDRNLVIRDFFDKYSTSRRREIHDYHWQLHFPDGLLKEGTAAVMQALEKYGNLKAEYKDNKDIFTFLVATSPDMTLIHTIEKDSESEIKHTIFSPEILSIIAEYDGSAENYKLEFAKPLENVFGVKDWKTYLGVKVVNPRPRPALMRKINNQWCPIFPFAKIAQTHIWTYKPDADGIEIGKKKKTLILNRLFKLVLKPLQGARANLNESCKLTISRRQREKSMGQGYWMLTPKRNIPNTTSKTYDQQVEEVVSKGYEVLSGPDLILRDLTKQVKFGEGKELSIVLNGISFRRISLWDTDREGDWTRTSTTAGNGGYWTVNFNNELSVRGLQRRTVGSSMGMRGVKKY